MLNKKSVDDINVAGKKVLGIYLEVWVIQVRQY